MNKRLLAYAGASVAVAIAFNIVSNGMFPYDADVTEAKDACDIWVFDGVASPLGPGQMRAEDCYMLGVLSMASVSAWLASLVAIGATTAFVSVYIIRVVDAKFPSD